MAKPYPVAARDALHKLFRNLLGQPGSADFVEDRFPRYVKVLRWRQGEKDGAGLEGHLKLGAALFNAGLFFDAHEYLEGVWREASGNDKTLLQGFIQVASALHKLEQDPQAWEGALYLVDRGMEKLERSGRLRGRQGALAALVEIRARIVAEDLDLADIPKLAL